MRIPSIYRYAFLLLMLLASMPGAVAQRQERKVTPVENEDGKPEKPQLHYYDIHGNKLANPVYIVAEADTVDRPGARPVYPRHRTRFENTGEKQLYLPHLSFALRQGWHRL